MLINKAPRVCMQRTLAVMLVLALNIHLLTGSGDAVMNARAETYGVSAVIGGEPAATSALLQIYLQANPAFSPTRPAIVGHGDIITYTLVVTNSSSMTQTQLVLTDVVPLGSTAITPTVSSSPLKVPPNGVGPWVWLIDELSPGDTFTVSHAVRVDALITVTAIVNVAQIRSDQTTPVTSNVTVHLFSGPPEPPPESWRYYMPIAGQSR